LIFSVSLALANAALATDKRLELRMGIHIGDRDSPNPMAMYSGEDGKDCGAVGRCHGA